MDPTILLILLQDGVVNGAVYALLALSLVLVFAVTRVILVPQGEFVAFGALSYAALDEGRLPGSVWLLCALGVAAFLGDALWHRRRQLRRPLPGPPCPAVTLVLPMAITASLPLSWPRAGCLAYSWRGRWRWPSSRRWHRICTPSPSSH